jgi:muramoyltetrapeptide carboxypeptidase
MNPTVVYPRHLRKGDAVAIVSPASIIDPTLVDGAVKAIEARGYRAVVMPHALGAVGSYSGTAADRLSDMRMALADDTVRAILCSRGGYGCVHLLHEVEPMVDAADPKWIIGFSDVSALHALWYSRGIVSIHGSMAKHLANFPAADPDNVDLWALLEGRSTQYAWASAPGSRPGTAEGRLVGGNLAVIADLISTPYDIMRPGVVLYIEDIAEPIYKVERILWQLRLSGVLPALRGLIVGQFTEYRSDRNFNSMESMICELTADYTYPVAIGAPIGHVDHNIPLLHGSTVNLTVGTDQTTLRFV